MNNKSLLMHNQDIEKHYKIIVRCKIKIIKKEEKITNIKLDNSQKSLHCKDINLYLKINF